MDYFAMNSQKQRLTRLLVVCLVGLIGSTFHDARLLASEASSAEATSGEATSGEATSGEAKKVEPIVLEAQARRVEVMQRAAEATISVFGLDGGGGGSGVLITPDGFALTNYHVSSACGDHMRCGLSDGSMVDAVIVGVDAVGDVSLIQLLGRDNFPTAPMGDSSKVRVGQWCFSAGNPFGLASNRQPSISMGIISGTNRYQYPAGTILEYADCIQTDAAVNPGNSGGPLFNMDGEIIGINGRCSFEKRGRINVGVGYAISINQIRMFLGMLHSGRLLDHATIGATAATDDSGRVVISNILSNSDAYRRGLRYGDEVISLADRAIETTNTFKNILGTLPKDIRVPIEIRRDGQAQTMLVRLSGVHRKEQLIKIVSMGLDGGPQVPPKKRDPQEPKEPDSEDSQVPNGKQRPESLPKNLDSPGQQDRPDQGKHLSKDSEEEQNDRLVKSMIEPTPGFSNYYYNRMKRQQLWDEMKSLGDYAACSDWKLEGQLAGESTRVELSIGSDRSDVTLGSRRSEYRGEISDAISERRQGGLAVAVRALREFLMQGPEKLGDTIYLGTLPVYQGLSKKLADQSWHDVLETLWYDARVRFHWDSEKQQISLVEVYGDEGFDPAEVYFDDYQTLTVSGIEYRFPRRLRLQYGTEILLVVELDIVDLGLEKSQEKNNESTEQASEELSGVPSQ